MISASKSTLSPNNLKILNPKLQKFLRIFLRSFVNPHPGLVLREIEIQAWIAFNLSGFFVDLLNIVELNCYERILKYLKIANSLKNHDSKGG